MLKCTECKSCRCEQLCVCFCVFVHVYAPSCKLEPGPSAFPWACVQQAHFHVHDNKYYLASVTISVDVYKHGGGVCVADQWAVRQVFCRHLGSMNYPMLLQPRGINDSRVWSDTQPNSCCPSLFIFGPLPNAKNADLITHNYINRTHKHSTSLSTCISTYMDACRTEVTYMYQNNCIINWFHFSNRVQCLQWAGLTEPQCVTD